MNKIAEETPIKYKIYQDKETGHRSLHAIDDIRQGETILVLPPYMQPGPDKFSIEVVPGVHVNCLGSFAGAINHSCTPNSAVSNWRIIAWACIAAGDEITINYKRTETKLAEPFNCECGLKNCKGRIE